MKHKILIRQTVIILLLHLFLCNIVFAQSEDTLKVKGSKLTIKKQPKIGTGFLNFKPFFSYKKKNTAPENKYFLSFPQNYKCGEYHLNNGFTYQQSKTAQIFYGRGGYEHYNNSLLFNASRELSVDIGFGIAKQSTSLNTDGPNLYFTLHSSLEYSINNTMSIYLKGQYLTCPINRSEGYFDPFLYMNQMFLQTETEVGLRTKYKNIKADIGVKTLHEKNFKGQKPISTINSKVTIGF